MQNTRIEITPLNISYASRKVLNLMIKFRRALISTNLQKQKFQCRKVLELKNSYVQLSAYADQTCYRFSINKDQELGNTKIDMMVFGLEDIKNLNLLGKVSIDLSIFLNQISREKSTYRQLKIPMEKSDDPRSFVTLGFFLQYFGRSEPNQKKIGENTMKSQTRNKDIVIIGRKNRVDAPSAYEISRRNFKNNEIVREDDRSKSKTRNASGSYKKRFQYQYNKQTPKIEEDKPQVAPKKRTQPNQQRGSPMPRIKTPQPISDLGGSFIQQKQVRTHRVTSSSGYMSSPNQIQKYNTLHSNEHEFMHTHKIVIDVEHSLQTNYISESSTYEEKVFGEEGKEQYPSQYDTHQWATFNPNATSQISSGFQNQRKFNRQQEADDSSGYSSVGKQNKFNSSGLKAAQNVKGSNQKQRMDSSNVKKTIEEDDNNRFKKSIAELNKNQSMFENKKIQNKDKIFTPVNESKKQRNQDQKQMAHSEITPVARNKKQVEESRNNKSWKDTRDQQSSSRKQDKFKDINSKLELILQQKIEEKKSSPGNEKSAKSSSFQLQNKDHSPINIFRPEKANKSHLQSSGDTFEENHFESQLQSSPEQNKNQDVKHIKSFSYEPEDLSRNRKNVQGQSKVQTTKKDSQKSNGLFESSVKAFDKMKLSNLSEGSVNNSMNIQLNPRNPQKPIAPQKLEESSTPNEQQAGKRREVENSSNVVAENKEKGSEEQVRLLQKQLEKMQLKYEGQLENAKQQQLTKNEGIRLEYEGQMKSLQEGHQQSIDKMNLELDRVVKQYEKKIEDIRRQHQDKIRTLEKKSKKMAEELADHEQKITGVKNTYEKKLEDLKNQYEDKIIALENQLDQQEESFRKQIMEKELEFRNQAREAKANQGSKNTKSEIQRIKQLQNEISELNKRQKELKKREKELTDRIKTEAENKNKFSSEQIENMREDNVRLKKIVDKMNQQLEQADEKLFEMQTAVQKKDLELKRKMDSLLIANAELQQDLKNKNKQIQNIKDSAQKQLKEVQSLKEKASLKNFGTLSNSSIKSEGLNSVAGEEQKSHQKMYLLEKKKNLNLQSQIRQKNNDLRFNKIRIDNLEQQKKDLQNEIDHLIANNKNEMAREGSLHKINLDSESVSNSVKAENAALKQQIISLQKQVQELNTLLEGLIKEGSIHEERLSSNKDTTLQENYQNLLKKYDALEKKCKAYEQDLKKSVMKVGQILNIIFSHNNRKLIDEVQKIL